MRNFLSDLVFALCLFSVFAVTPAHAYLDGATISLILQAVAGAAASFMLFGKMQLRRLKSLFSRGKTED